MPLTAGTRLGSYEVIAKLGDGGMGEVYRALDTRLKRQVAIKVLPSSVAADTERLARFQREAEVLASLNHPHIAAIYGLEEATGRKALVMELVEGETLADRIARAPCRSTRPCRSRARSPKRSKRRTSAASSTAIQAGEHQVRDDGTVKVLDFGLAKLTEPGASRDRRSERSRRRLRRAAMTGIGIILGTAAYMSPEQARGRAVDKRTDVWAFGAVLYEMLARRRHSTARASPRRLPPS